MQGLSRPIEALASYELALALQPNLAEALNNRGNTLQSLKRIDEALAATSARSRPDFAEPLYNRGMILHELKRFDEALVSYDRALAVRPDYIEALYNRGTILQELKRLDEALETYDRALAANAGSRTRLQRSRILRDQPLRLGPADRARRGTCRRMWPAKVDHFFVRVARLQQRSRAAIAVLPELYRASGHDTAAADVDRPDLAPRQDSRCLSRPPISAPTPRPS